MTAVALAAISTLAPILTILANGYVRYLTHSSQTVTTDSVAAAAPMHD